MKYFYRIISIIKNSFKNIVNRPSRFFLTVFGIVISSLILSFCYFTLDSYFYHNKNKYEIYNVNNAILVTGSSSKENHERFSKLINEFSKNNFYDRGNRSLFFKDHENNNLRFLTKLYGTNENFLNYPIPEFYNTNFLHIPKLLYGRQILNSDIQEKRNVVVIDDILSVQLFGSENGVGQTLTFDIFDFIIDLNGVKTREKVGIESFEVIGIIKHSKTSFNKFKEFINIKEINSYETIIYIPITYEILQKESDENFVENKINFISVITNLKESDINNLKLSSNYFVEPGSYLNIEDYDSIMHEINYMVSNSNILIDIVSIILLIISAISIFNTLIFSIKEKVTEFGIKKALGAKNIDILFEVFTEGLIFGIIGTIIGIIISSFLVSIFLPTINHYLQSDFDFFISFRTLSFIFVLPILVTIISTLPVAIYASKIKIVDAIRHE